MRYIISLLFFVTSALLFGKEIHDFSFPDSLKQGADAVVVYDHIEYERTSLTQLKETRKLALTILNKEAEDLTAMYVDYDKLSTVDKFACSTYNSRGIQVKKYKKGDINDFSHYSSYTFYSDNRVKHVRAQNPSFPYTILFEYQKTYDSFFILSAWMPLDSYRLAIYKSSLTVKSSVDLPFMFKALNNVDLSSENFESEGVTVNTWNLESMKAIEYEDFAPSFFEQVPIVYLAPKDFEFDDHKGSNASWNKLGVFANSLFDKDEALTDETKHDLDDIKSRATDERHLVQLVYEYMQAKTRYVGIQLGIGGWQPFPSIDVDETGYGDCKALSFYTKVMLKYVGVNSVYVVLGSGRSEIEYDDFTSNQTNHAILCVPSASDTIWLECTSQVAPFDYLSSSCTNRNVLLVEGDDSHLYYVAQKHDNIRKRTAEITIDSDNRVLCKNVLHYEGVFFDRHNDFAHMSAKELTKYLQRSTPVSDINILKCNAEINKDSATVEVYNEFYASGQVTSAGNRLIVDLTPFAQIANVRKQRDDRRTPLVLKDTKNYIDHIDFNLPQGYEIEFIPESNSFESKFGDYSFDVSLTDDVVRVERNFLRYSGDFSTQDYYSYVDFINKAAKNDRCKLILKKSE